MKNDKKITDKKKLIKNLTKKENNKPKSSKSNNKLKEELVNLLLKLLIIIKIYHWKTHSHAEHKATDHLYESLNEKVDRFVEVLLGKEQSRLNMKGKVIEISDPSTTEELQKIVYDYRVLLQKKMDKYISVNIDTDLLNIRDEILADLNQFLYLLTFY
jgi:DNA-binding ferritin-like protein